MKILKTDSAAIVEYSPVLENRYTKKSKYGDVITLCKRIAGNRLMLPRGLFPVGEVDARVKGASFDINGKFKARNSEQTRVVKEAVKLLEHDQSHIVQAPTGFGKTAVATEIIRQIGVSTLIIVPKEDIKQQWIDAFEKFWGLERKEIGVIQGDKYNVAGKKVSIAMIQSVCKKGRYPDWVYRTFGLLVVDEVHKLGATQFSEAAWLFPAKLRLGLSATPQRKDGKDVVFRSHIGNVAVVTDAIPMIPKVLRVRFKNLTVGKVPHKHGRTMHINKILVKDVFRSKYIAEFIGAAYKKGRNVVFFSDLTVHLETMRDYALMNGVALKDIGFYVGGLTEEERDEAKRKSVVFATYKMCSEGTDAPWWDTAILGTPRSDVVQIIGRILREYPDKKQPLVLDVIDASSKVFNDYSSARWKWYAKIGAEVKTLN